MLIPILDDPLHIARRVYELDPDLFVAWNPVVQRYEVHDRKAKGSTLVMRVQEPDGSFRPLDHRVLDALMRGRRERFDQLFRELEEQERRRRAAWERKVRDIAEGLADDLSFAGKRVVQGVTFGDGGGGGQP